MQKSRIVNPSWLVHYLVCFLAHAPPQAAHGTKGAVGPWFHMPARGAWLSTSRLVPFPPTYTHETTKPTGTIRTLKPFLHVKMPITAPSICLCCYHALCRLGVWMAGDINRSMQMLAQMIKAIFVISNYSIFLFAGGS